MQKGRAESTGGRKKGEEAASDDDEDQEVRESQWLGKALRRQQAAAAAAEAKRQQLEKSTQPSRSLAKARPGGKKVAMDGMPVSEDEHAQDASSEEEEEETLASFHFDGDDDAVEEMVSGWKMSAAAVGESCAHAPTPPCARMIDIRPRLWGAMLL